MTEATWALFDAGNRLVGQLTTTGAAPTMAEAGFSRTVRTARQADLSIEVIDPTTGAIAEMAALVEAVLVGMVKAEAERRKMLTLSAGGAKKTEYSDKAREVADWDTLGATPGAILAALAILSPAAQAARFPFATASAVAFADKLADAIERFRAGIGRAAPVHRIAAIEERACTAIRAATTAAAKRAAFAAINWS